MPLPFCIAASIFSLHSDWNTSPNSASSPLGAYGNGSTAAHQKLSDSLGILRRPLTAAG